VLAGNRRRHLPDRHGDRRDRRALDTGARPRRGAAAGQRPAARRLL
jgi:hypothetical protein